MKLNTSFNFSIFVSSRFITLIYVLKKLKNKRTKFLKCPHCLESDSIYNQIKMIIFSPYSQRTFSTSTQLRNFQRILNLTLQYTYLIFISLITSPERRPPLPYSRQNACSEIGPGIAIYWAHVDLARKRSRSKNLSVLGMHLVFFVILHTV